MSRIKVAVDAVVFGYIEKNLQVLLIKRGVEPFKNTWALPGGFVKADETFDDAVLRELEEETSITGVYLEQLYTFSDVDRDPRGRIISASYYCLVSPSQHTIKASTDAKEVSWFSIKELPELAFDHRNIIEVAYERLKSKIKYRPIGFELLPEKFTFPELQNLFETILNRKIERSNFQKRIKSFDLVKEVGSKGSGKTSAKIFKYNKNSKQLAKDGSYIELFK